LVDKTKSHAKGRKINIVASLPAIYPQISNISKNLIAEQMKF
jgi:hypothetical protein